MTMGSNNKLNISWLCDNAGVSRSGYYSWLSHMQERMKKELRDRVDFELIIQAYKFRGYDKAYLSVILDAFTKQVLSYVLSESLEVDFVLETINKLIDLHGISLDCETLIHSDQGCHYTSIKFQELIKNNELRQSMSRRGNCWDNAPQESFFGHMKDEVHVDKCETFSDLQFEFDDYMDYYNNDRYQWDLAKLSPNEYAKYYETGEYPIKV